MTDSNRLMRAAIKKVLLPQLKPGGFTGSGYDFRRARPEWLDLLALQWGKHGGEFILEFARRPRGPMTASWGAVFQEQELTVAHTHPLERARLQPSVAPTGSGLCGFEFAHFGDEKAQYEQLVVMVVGLLPQVEDWLRNGNAGTCVRPVKNHG